MTQYTYLVDLVSLFINILIFLFLRSWKLSLLCFGLLFVITITRSRWWRLLDACLSLKAKDPPCSCPEIQEAVENQLIYSNICHTLMNYLSNPILKRSNSDVP